MSEQLKQEVDTAEIDRLETETDVDSKTYIWGKLHLLRFLQEWRIQQKRKLELQKLRMQSR